MVGGWDAELRLFLFYFKYALKKEANTETFLLLSFDHLKPCMCPRRIHVSLSGWCCTSSSCLASYSFPVGQKLKTEQFFLWLPTCMPLLIT